MNTTEVNVEMDLTVIYPDIRVHRTGCADIKRDLRSGKYQAGSVVNGFGSLEAIVDDLNASYGWPYEGSDEPAPWRLSSLDVAPCVK